MDKFRLWIKEMPYFEIKHTNPSLTKRFYLVTGNIIVYSKHGSPEKISDVYSRFHKNPEGWQDDTYALLKFPRMTCNVARNYFLVFPLGKEFLDITETPTMLNGIPLNRTISNFNSIILTIVDNKNMFPQITLADKSLDNDTRARLDPIRKHPNEIFDWPDDGLYNKHLQGAYKKQVFPKGYEFGMDDRRLFRTDPRAPYRERWKDVKSVLHWGQRKLLMSEIEFITNNYKASSTVVYAGAAPGNHVLYLSDMFPSHKFVLYDPRAFNKKLVMFSKKHPDKVELHNDFFTNETASEWNGKRVLFISDIRTSGDRDQLFKLKHIMRTSKNRIEKARATKLFKKIESDAEKAVGDDNDMMMGWVLIMEPERAMLKFRMPWNVDTWDGLDGDIFFQAWEGPTSGETRLVMPTENNLSLKKRRYDRREYEDQMFYFNTETRMSYYHHPYSGEHAIDGIDHCYDCRTELYILERYCKNILGVNKKSEKIAKVKELSEGISTSLGYKLSEYVHRVS